MMFSPSLVEQQFIMTKDKARPMIVYGLCPALKGKQQTKINTWRWFSVPFNENLKHHQQICQMDVKIPSWDDEKNCCSVSLK